MAKNDGGGAHDDYLNSPDTAGRPMALISLITVFLVIAAIALALFIGGRWFYNEVVKSDEDQTTSEVATTEDGQTQEGGDSGVTIDGEPANGEEGAYDEELTEEEIAELEAQEEASSQGGSGGGEEGSSEGGQGSGNTGEGATSEDGSESEESINAGGPTEEQGAASGTVTGPTEAEEVPNTGPESMLAIFIGATVIGAIAHRKWLVNKL